MGTELTDQEHALPLGQGFKPLVLVEPDQGQKPTRSRAAPARLTAKQLRQGHRFGLPGTVLDHTRNRDFATCHGSLQCSSRQTDSVGTFQRAQVLRYGRRCRTGRFSGGNYFHGWSSFKGIISKLTGLWGRLASGNPRSRSHSSPVAGGPTMLGPNDTTNLWPGGRRVNTEIDEYFPKSR